MLTLNKKGVSVIVSYVVLVMIVISLSALVYSWLRFYVTEDSSDDLKCPDDVSLIISYYECRDLSDGQELDIALQNKGFFSFDGFIVRVNTRPGADIGVHVVDDVGVAMPAGSDSFQINYTSDDLSEDKKDKPIIGSLTFVEVQPFIEDDNGRKIVCDTIARQPVECVV